jgi:hypothetical protein
MSHLTHFEGNELLVIEVNGRRAFTAETVGKALEYEKPGPSINNIHRRNDKEFEQGIDWDWFNAERGQIDPAERHQIDAPKKSRYSTRIYYQTGVNLIGMLSDQPKAALFRRWAKQVLAAHQAPHEDPEAATLEAVTKSLGFERRCKICRSPLRDEIDTMLDDPTLRYEDIIAFAAERGLVISQAGLSRHRSHRLPDAAPISLATKPEVGMAILFAKLLDEVQRRKLNALSDRELVKYAQAAGQTLLTSRRSGTLALPIGGEQH